MKVRRPVGLGSSEPKGGKEAVIPGREEGLGCSLEASAGTSAFTKRRKAFGGFQTEQ